LHNVIILRGKQLRPATLSEFHCRIFGILNQKSEPVPSWHTADR